MDGSLRWRQAFTPVALAFVSLFAALALWVAVTDAENPSTIRDFPGTIPLQAVSVPEGLAVYHISQPGSTSSLTGVRVRVSGPEDVIEELTTANFSATVDLTRAPEGLGTYQVRIRTVGVENVEIVEVTPRDVDVMLETEVTKQVTVQVNRSGQLPAGYSVGTIEASPFEARVTGALSRVQLVQSAAVDVSLTGARTTLQGQYRLTPIDSTGAEVPRVRVEPSNAEVRIVINQQEAILVLPVQVVTQGTPAEGYRVASAAANPQVVALTGTHETLQGVTELLTDPIDIGGVSADVTRSATVKIPAGLKATRESVNVSIRVVPQQGERLVQVAPEVINPPAGLNATSQTISLSVQVRGDVPLINALPPGAVRATVNAANLPEGVHVLMPDIIVPPGVTFVAVQPPQVVLVIGR